jgi:formate dehydrogenase maturation protein FdhE
MKHADWQPIPQAVSKNLPVCPICKERPKWEVYDKYGWTARGYKIVCNLCGAEWEYMISKPKNMIFGGAFAALSMVAKITDDNSIWILRKTGSNQEAYKFLDKEMNFSAWKQMVGRFCGKCGTPLARSEKFCPKCGAERE